ncbi:hypothetical protein Taro_018216 [Colocasia esculenta]|uniref:Retrotransposon gag domain-containing protein n=1 Tax=Colocasia esculenta TaxID=4460 RepID=A0A843UI69_COLES|nr:hypothetical protein [Colocasia esculenta]
MLPLFGGLRLHGCRVSRTGQSVDVGLGKATASYVTFRSRRRAASHSQPLCIFKEVLAEQSCGKLISAKGGCCGDLSGDSDFWRSFGALSPRGRHVEWGRRRTMDGVVLVGLHCSLACACGATVGPFVRNCETKSCGVPWWWHSCVKVLPVVECLVVALVWLWFSWWYLMVVEVVSVAWDPHPREPVEGDVEVVEAVLFPAWPRQSFVSLPLSTLVPERRSGARRGAVAWPGCGGACVLMVFCGGSVSLFWGGIVGLALLAHASGGFHFSVLLVPLTPYSPQLGALHRGSSVSDGLRGQSWCCVLSAAVRVWVYTLVAGRWCWLDSTVLVLIEVEPQLNLSSVATRLRGSPVWLVQSSEKLCSARGFCYGIFGRFGLLGLGVTSFHYKDATWSRGNLVRASFFTFFTKLESTVLYTCLVKRQLDLSSVAARLRGSFPTEPVTREAHPYLLPGVVMAERRNVGDEGEGAGEDPTQRMIERIWESLTEIQIQQMKREQFRTLQQGNLSVLEYHIRFIALSRTELIEALLGQGVLLWNFWAIRLVRAWHDEFPPQGRYVERREPRTGFVLRVLHEVERQLDLSSVAARLRGSPVLFVQVKKSRRTRVLPLVRVSVVVESGPRHQQSNCSYLWSSGGCLGLLDFNMAMSARAEMTAEVILAEVWAETTKPRKPSRGPLSLREMCVPSSRTDLQSSPRGLSGETLRRSSQSLAKQNGLVYGVEQRTCTYGVYASHTPGIPQTRRTLGRLWLSRVILVFDRAEAVDPRGAKRSV